MAIQIERGAEPLPGYKLLERLGGGGFGEVWKAEAPGGLLKAIKFVYGDAQAASDEPMRAEQELKALSRVKAVRHPYILSLERYDVVEGRLIVVMELADRNLWDKYRECRSQGLPGIPREDLLRFMAEAAEALDLMNIQYQLQHLDIKPQNLFLVQNHVKVADFGLVKDLQGRETRVTGGVTPVYAPPETFEGRVSRHGDQYSLAIVYQELLTGTRPYRAGNVHQLILQHLREVPDLAPLPEGDREPIGKALAKNPEERHPSCTDLVQALQAAASTELPAGVRTASRTRPDVSYDVFMKADTMPATARAAQPDRSNASVAAPPLLTAKPEDEVEPISERTGPGVLFPALVLGLGRAGQLALRQIHSDIVARFGSREALPNVRLLCIDTHPSVRRELSEDAGARQLPAADYLPVPLRRAGHFLRLRDSKASLERWFNTRLLYRIQRSHETGGLRPLGRLAFVDNARLIVERLRRELEACLEPAALNRAVRASGLEMRSNRPRVYIVVGLAGGTGGGMFIDVAYTVQRVLRNLGHGAAEVIGVLLLARPDEKPQSVIPAGNTYAALTELHHFSCPQNSFSASYDHRDLNLVETGPPFARCCLIPYDTLPGSVGEAPRLAGNLVYQELFTELARVAAETRVRTTGSIASGSASYACSFGLAEIRWPRRLMVLLAARRYCRQLVEHWIAKDASSLRESVNRFLRENWGQMEIGPEMLIARVQEAGARLTGKPVDTAIAELVQPLRLESRRSAEFQPRTVATAMARLEELVGQPPESAVVLRPSSLEDTLEAASREIVRECQPRLMQLMAALLEDPEFRLAGAEEAVRQIVVLLEQTLQHYEPLLNDVTTKASQAYERVRLLLNAIHEQTRLARRPATAIGELLDLAVLYPTVRYQSLVLKRLAFIITSLRGYLSDQLRELSFYRLRLGDLLAAFGDELGPALPESRPHCRDLFPPGCATMGDAVHQLFPVLSPAELLEIDRRMQGVIREEFGSLGHICMAPVNLLKNLEITLGREVGALAEGRLRSSNVVEMFLNRFSEPKEAQVAVAASYAEATPALPASSPPGSEFAVVLAPASASDSPFAQVLQAALPNITAVPVASKEEILFYRERHLANLRMLEQLSPIAEAAYRQMASSDQFPPHARADIIDWEPIGVTSRRLATP